MRRKNQLHLESLVEEQTAALQQANQILAGQVWVGRFTNRKKDGTTYLEEATISPVSDEQGKIINFVAVKKDITKEVALERQLNQAQKLESIGILAAGMAHEINTPIQYLLSNTQFLKGVLEDFTEMQTGHDNLVNAVSAAGAFDEEVAAINRLAEELDLAYLKVEADKALLETLEGINPSGYDYQCNLCPSGEI